MKSYVNWEYNHIITLCRDQQQIFSLPFYQKWDCGVRKREEQIQVLSFYSRNIEELSQWLSYIRMITKWTFRMVHSYFKAVRFMCPRLQIQEDRSMDEYDQVSINWIYPLTVSLQSQVEQWGRQALKAVSNRLDSITRNGYSPLIPREFSKVVSSIALLSKQKLSEAVVYLVRFE